MATGVGNGTTLTLGTSSWAPNITRLSASSSRPAVENTHLGSTGGRSFIPDDLPDYEEITIEGFHSGDTGEPITGAAETGTIDWAGDGTSNKEATSCFLTNYSPTATIGEMMTFTATLKRTGARTIS